MSIDSTRPTPDPGLPEARISHIEHQARGREALASAIREVHLRGAAIVGDDYFPAIVADIGRVLKANYVLVGRISETSNAVETIAVYANGKIVENFTYFLEHTPCKIALADGVCVYCDSVCTAFPQDQLLIDMGIEGYVGISLIGSEGTPSGIIVAMYEQPVEDPDFASTLMLVFAARTAAELDRQRLETQLLRAQKLESLGVLAGGLAHDFNNLLSSILGSADLALLHLPDSHASRDNLGLIRNAATDAGELCRQLLAYAGKGRFEMVPLNLSTVVREQEKLLRMSVSKAASLQLELSDDLPACQADVAQIRQILLNLVVNASEALSTEGGTIRICTGTGDFSQEYLASADMEHSCAPGHYVFVEVSDSGVGMSAEVRALLFDPFFTTKLTGRGLGLAAILGIVKGHAGSIKVYTEPGEGSSFKVFFPVIEESVSLGPKIADANTWRASGLALIVDDDERVADVCSRMMQAIGFETVLANSGQHALEIFCERSADLDVVLLDLTMPQMSGDEVFRNMRRIDPNVPVVLTSGFNEQDTIQEFVGRGLAGFLQKPIQLKEMRERMRLATDTN